MSFFRFRPDAVEPFMFEGEGIKITITLKEASQVGKILLTQSNGIDLYTVNLTVPSGHIATVNTVNTYPLTNTLIIS